MLNGIEIKKLLGLCAEHVFTLGLLPVGRIGVQLCSRTEDEMPE